MLVWKETLFDFTFKISHQNFQANKPVFYKRTIYFADSLSRVGNMQFGDFFYLN